MIDVNVNISEFEKVLSKYADALEPALEAGLDVAAERVQEAKHREIRKTYKRQPQWQRPAVVQRTVKGKVVNRKVRAQWKRKGTAGGWAGSQTIEKSRLQRVIKDTGASANYVGRLATLPTSPDGVNRANPAAETAARITKPQLAPLCEAAIRNKLGF